MNNFAFDKYLDIANEERKKRGLDNYLPLCPMLRLENDKLYVAILLTKKEDKVWDKDGNVKADYWMIVDINTDKVVEFNKTSEKDFINGEAIEKSVNYNQKEIAEYTVKKTMQYKNYLIEDIKNEKLPIQKELSSILGDEMEFGGETFNINEYVLACSEEEINEKVNELVHVLVTSKYGSLSFYYDILFKDIINEYKEKEIINTDKIKLCLKIMNAEYDGVNYIDNLFNL